jgi:GT2 family glycosyltransferase
MSRVSFVVPVLNDARRLDMCLRSIRRNFAAPGTVEIVVVDNGSTDGSPDVARTHGARVIIVSEGRVSELRNIGAAQASGDVLAFVDADHEIAAGWIAAALAELRRDGVGAVGAQYRPPLDGTWVQRAYGRLRGHARGQQDVAWLGSGNLAVWREAFECIGGFDTSLEACEDVDLCARLRAAGHRLISDARLDTIHHGDPETLRQVFTSELWRGRDNLRVTFRTRPMPWPSLASALIPVIDLVLLPVALIGLVLAALGSTFGLPLAAGAAAVVLTGTLAKVVRALQREAPARAGALAATFLVACAYDLGRAFALFARSPHRGRARTISTTAVS